MDLTVLDYSEQDISNLFCRPQVLAELIEACLSGQPMTALAELVLRDAALCARLVQAASKVGHVELDPTEPVSSAVQQLGVPVVTGIALQAAKQLVAHDFTQTELVYLNGLWYSSRVAGQIARCLAATVGYLNVEEAQFCGLLLNLGLQAQFARHGGDYARLAKVSRSTAALRRREQLAYRFDHLQVAERLIEPWKLDSFLIDAIRFLHSDAAEIENCGQLLKIARLTQQACLQPERLADETVALAERLFQFSPSEAEYLFSWARGLYLPELPPFGEVKRLAAELRTAKEQLIELIFALADQEGARARLAGCSRPEQLVREARDLYLENCPATEALFLLVDHQHEQLAGVVAPGQARLISELKIPLDASLSLVVQALVRGELVSSFEQRKPLTVTDQLLLRLSGGKAFCCQPFRLEGRLLGAVVLGLEAERSLPNMQSLRLRMFAQVVSEALAQLSLASKETFAEGGGLLHQVSHELGNPLTIISNYAEVIGHLLQEPEHRELSDAIKREVRRIDDIVAYYLNQQELPPFPDRNVNLNRLVQEAVDALQETDLQPRQIGVRFDLENRLDRVATNGVLVKQVLVNLLKNAAESVAPGGEIRLLTRDSYCSDGEHYAEVVVQDSGAGLEPQQREQLFRPLAGGNVAGPPGDGLRIVKGMVDDLGGRISYYSSPATGTGFHLQIPCDEETLPPAESA